MSSIFLIHAIKVQPQASSEMRRSHPRAEGAYLDCYVPGNSVEDALERVRETLESDAYLMLGYDESREIYCDGEWLYDEMPPGVREKAEEVVESGDVVYGEFHVW